MKKILALSLVLMMVLALVLTGCGGSGNQATTAAATTAAATTAAKTTAAGTAAATTAAPAPAEIVTVDWYNRDGEIHNKKGYQPWLDWMNEYCGEKANVNVDYHSLSVSDYEQKVTAVLSAGQPCDIMFTSASQLSFPVWQSRDAFAPLDDLMNEYAQETLAIIPEYVWDAARINGVLYAMPTYKDMTTFAPLTYNETIVEAAGLLDTVESMEYYTLYDLNDILYGVKEYRDSQKPEYANLPVHNASNWDHHYFAYDQLASVAYTAIPGTNGFVEDGYDNGEIVFNKYATKEYEKKALYIKQLVDDSILAYDWKNLGDTAKTWWQDGVYVTSLGWGDVSVEADKYEGYTMAIKMPKLSFTGTAYIRAVMQAINAASEADKQVASMKLLNLLYSDELVSTSYHFGAPELGWKTTEIDGQKWATFEGTYNEDPKDRGYYYWYHAEAGNLFTSLLAVGMTPEFFTVLDSMNTNSQTSANMGFSPDTVPVENEIAALAAVIAEYDDTLTTGMLPDIAPVLSQFNEKLNANGAEKVVTEMQAQLDAWKAAQ